MAAFGDKNGKPDTYYAGTLGPEELVEPASQAAHRQDGGLSGPTSTSGGLYPISALINAGFKCSASSFTARA